MPQGELIPVPCNDLRKFTNGELMHFMWKHGIYTLPTTELINFLRMLLPPVQHCLEIGAGTGAIGKALGIRTTDSKLQERADMVEKYRQMGQPVIIYPSHVEKIDANEAILRYKPRAVIGSYITHRWDGKSGNPDGPDLLDIVITRRVKLILIGNDNVHFDSPLMNVEHASFQAHPSLITRSEPSKNWIKIWNPFAN